MKGVFALFLLVACSQAIDLSKLKPKTITLPINPKHKGPFWDYIKKNQVIKSEVHPGSKAETKPQSAVHTHHSRIVGGQTAFHGEFPWQCLITMDNNHFCGGSLLSSNWVLTAGHCGYGYTNFVVVLGAEDSSNSGETGRQTFQTQNKYVHEQFNPNTLNNDLTLLWLPQQASMTQYVNTIPLAPSSWQDITGQVVTISGWGKPSDTGPGITRYLRYVSVSVISNQQCAQTYGNMITSTKICTSTQRDLGTCFGDSGGPLMLADSTKRYFLVGVVSFVDTLGCEKGYPDGFSRVTSYLDWIQAKTGI